LSPMTKTWFWGTTIGPKEAWVFKCQTGDTVVSREVIVDRGQTLDLGNACRPAK
jgi:hypothetical protein